MVPGETGYNFEERPSDTEMAVFAEAFAVEPIFN
jgi:hypothetical protein